jgi:hypothetical protein
MKKTNIIFTLLSILLLGALIFQFGCSKDRIEVKPLNAYASPNNYLNSKKQQEQIDTIYTNGVCPLTGQQGTQLCMANTCLQFPNGDSVHFPYTIGLIEIYKPKDMIYAQMPTIASGNILETAGEVRVRAYKNGTELSLRPGCSYTINMPNSSPQNYMQAYYGDDGDNYTDWSNTPSPAVNTNFNTVTGYYSNSITKFGWLNCDYNRAAANNHKLTFTSKTDSLTNVAIFIYFPSTKTVMQVFNLVSGNIPDGSNVKIIAIGVKTDGTLYNFYQTQLVTSSSSVEVTMQSISDSDLTTLLDGL